MKAGIYHGVKNVTVEELAKPTIGAKDVLVKNVCSGICGTDITAYTYGGDAVRIFPGDEFGHEMVGYICEVGEETTGFAVGQKVFVNPTNCKREGMIKCSVAGAFSEYVTVEDAQWGKNLLKLNDDVAYADAVIAEPLAVATHGKNVVGTKPEDNVVIYGAGPIGLGALSVLVASGNNNVVVVDNNEARLKLVEELGGTPLNFEKEDKDKSLKERFGTSYSNVGYPVPNVDVVIDCAGVPSVINDYVYACKKGARFSIIAIAKKPIEIDTASIMKNESKIFGSCGYAIEDIEEVLGYINSHKIKSDKIVSHHFPISKLSEAFDTAQDISKQAVKVIIEWE